MAKAVLIVRPKDGKLEEALGDEVRIFRHYVQRATGDARILPYGEGDRLWLTDEPRSSRWELLTDQAPSEDVAIYSPVKILFQRFDIIDRAMEVRAKEFYANMRYQVVEVRRELLEGFRPWFEQQLRLLWKVTVEFEVKL